MTAQRELKPILLRWLRRTGLAALFIVALIFISAFSMTYLVLNTEDGTQWALQTTQRLLPQLSFTHAGGSLLRGINAEQIRWHDADIDVELDSVRLQLRFAHLLHGEVHLTTLHADTLRITPLGPSSGKPVKLSPIFLPFTLSTPDLAIKRLDVINSNSTFTLNDIRSGIRWRTTTLQFNQTQTRWDDIALHLDGDIGFRGDYPLHSQGQLTLPQWPGPIDISTQGDLRHLQLSARTATPYALDAQIKLATLDKNLPLQIHAELKQSFTQNIGPEKIAVEKATLDADGDLTQIHAQLALAANDSRYGDSKLTANAQWRIEEEKMALDAQWQPAAGNLQLHCDASLQKPISTVCNGEAQSIALTPWLNGQSAEISSPIALEAKWLDPQWMLSLSLPNLNGKYNGTALSATVDLHTDDGEQWQLRQLALTLGSNTVKAAGEFGKRYRLRGNINTANLAQIDSQLGGNLSGDFSIDGDNKPSIAARVRGSQLRWDDIHTASANIELNLAQLGEANSSAHLEIQQLARGDSTAINLALDSNGKQSQQRFTLHAAQQQQRATLSCTTQSSADWQAWQFVCDELAGQLNLRKRGNPFEWHNTATLRGTAQIAQKNFELSPFCLRGNDADSHNSAIELCLDQALRVVDAKPQIISAHASGIPLQWGRPWFPDTVALLDDPRASAQLQLRSTAPLDAQASLQIPATSWRWRTLKSAQTTDIDAIRVDASLNAQRALISTNLQSSSIGRIAAQLTVNNPRDKRELDGRLNIEHFQLQGIAWAFEGLDSISGEINGAVDIGGTAAAPQLRGQLLLKDGNALWAPLGAPFRTVHADLTFNNDSAKLGGWFALGQGGGDIDGEMHWNNAGDNWKARVGLVAGGLSVMPLSNSLVVFSPHAELTAAPDEIHVDGYVDIASAEIQLKELPPETTDVSQDQEIVGQTADEDALKIWAKLGLNLGDQFHLTGFGADVNLSGRLELNKAPGDNMHLLGEVKVPRGRYRAYGQRLTVRKGSVIFYGPPDNPDLNLEAVRDMPPGVTDVVGLRVIGSLKTPEAILFSEPSMTDSDIAYYLLTGRKPVAGTTGTAGYSASGALLSLGLAGSESKAGQLAQKFGITDLQLGTGENASGQNEAEVSGQLGKDLFVRYGRGLGQQSNSISFQYRLTPKLMIETISGIEDALDLLYSFEIK